MDNTRFIGNFFAEAKLHKNLTYKVSIGYDTKTARGYKYNSSKTAAGIVQGTGKQMEYKAFITKEEAVALIHRAVK